MLNVAFDGDFDEDDWRHALGGSHALVIAGNVIVAHAAVVARVLDIGGRSVSTGYVEAVATIAAHRRKGYGTLAMNALADVIAAEYELGALSTGEHAFYASLGWERWQGKTYVQRDGVRTRTPAEDDAVMVRRVPRTAAIDLRADITCDWRPGDVW